MKRILTLLTLLICLPVLHAQSEAELTGTRKQEVMKQITDATVAIRSLSCQFTQTKQSALLAQPAVAKGRMNYTRPDRLQWEYTSPTRYKLEVAGDSLRMTDANGRPTGNSQSSRLMRGLSDLIIGSINGQKLFDERMFATRLYDDGKQYRAEMTPRRRDMQRMFQRITFCFDKQKHTITSVVLTEKAGDSTTIAFENIAIK